MLREAEKTTQAAISGADLAAQSLASDREIGEAQVRAYLTADRINVIFNNNAPEVRLELTNTGNSPASDVLVDCLTFADIDGDPIPGEPFAAGTMLDVVRPSADARTVVVPLGFSIIFPATAKADALVTVKVRIKINFLDVFKKRQTQGGEYTGFASAPLPGKGITLGRTDQTLYPDIFDILGD